MIENSRSHSRPVLWGVFKRTPLPFLVLAFALSSPAIVLFCLHIADRGDADNGSASGDARAAFLLSKQGAKLTASQMASARGFAGGETGFGILDQSASFFREASRRGQMPAYEDDPFVWALRSGAGEGNLKILRYENGIPVLGPAAWKARPNPASDREILQALRLQAGGSFKNFFAHMFGEAGSSESWNDSAEAETNPFAKAREERGEKPAELQAESVTEAKADPPATTAPGEVKESTSEPNNVQPATPPASTPKPYFMMHVGDDGALQSLTPGQASPDLLMAPGLAEQDFNQITFTDAPDFPTALAVADFNGDGLTDVALNQGPSGKLRFFYGQSDGSYQEQLRIDVGGGPHSVAVGDFNRDGLMDIAISPVGEGPLTFLFVDAGGQYRYRVFWPDAYRDYILAADIGNKGVLDLVGMTFDNRGSVLVDFGSPEGQAANRRFEYLPSLTSEINSSRGLQARLNAVVLASNLALNIENRMRQLVNVLNVAAGSKVYVLVGDVDRNGRMAVTIASPRRKP